MYSRVQKHRRKRLAVGVESGEAKSIRRDLMGFLRAPERSWTHLENLGEEKHGDLFYIDNGSDILAVAHTDSVQSERWVRDVGDRIYYPQLDDKLGIYTICKLLPQYGIIPDILLTDNEEMAMSTAKDFVPEKKYKWMFEFDRGGDDVVMYQYDGAVTRQALKSVGAKPGFGSYSDIADLEHLGCAGWNWGNGMYDYHSRYAYVDFEEYLGMVDLFVLFWDSNKDIRFEFEYVPPAKTKYSAYERHEDYRWMHDWETGEVEVADASFYECLYCGSYFDATEILSTPYGELCVECAHICGVDGYTLEEEMEVWDTTPDIA